MTRKRKTHQSTTLAAMQARALAANATAKPENRRPITLRDLSKPRDQD